MMASKNKTIANPMSYIYYYPCQFGSASYTYSTRKNRQSEWLRTTYVNLCHTVTTQLDLFERLHCLGSLWTLLHQDRQVLLCRYLEAGLSYEAVNFLTIFSQIEKTLPKSCSSNYQFYVQW